MQLMLKLKVSQKNLDANDPSLSARCRDAISYSLNQKEYIVRFAHSVFLADFFIRV